MVSEKQQEGFSGNALPFTKSSAVPLSPITISSPIGSVYILRFVDAIVELVQSSVH